MAKKTQPTTSTTKSKFDLTRLMREATEHTSHGQAELDIRVLHKERGYDVYDRLYRSYINPTTWPFSSKVFDPRPFAAIFDKTSRLIAAPLQGRLVPREAGDEIGAKIGSALLAYQWDQADRGGTMLSKVARTDMGTRKYGTNPAFVSWRRETRVIGGKKVVKEGPEYEPLNVRDVLYQPGATSVSESDWVQVRRYVTLDELKNVNASAKSGPIYDPETLKVLEAGANAKTVRNSSMNRQIIGLNDSPAADSAFKRIEIITEYRRDVWISYSPMAASEKGEMLPLRVIDNPYNHGQIPIVPLTYYPIDDDIVGMSELEPVASLFKAINAFLNLALDTGAQDLFGPIMLNPVNVRLNTIDFKPKAIWFMNNPNTDIKKLESSGAAMAEFVNIYKVLTASAAEALGESTQGVSNITLGGTKTATEVKDLSLLRSARDNLNRLMLKDHLTKVMELWWSMDKQFMDKETVIRIAGPDAIKYFVDEGLAGYTLSDDGLSVVEQFMAEHSGMPFDAAFAYLKDTNQLEQYAVPQYSVQVKGQQAPKLRLNSTKDAGFLTIEPNDMGGEYDFIADVEAMSLPNDNEQLTARLNFYNLVRESRPDLLTEGYKVKSKELLSKIAEYAKIKDAAQYFEKVSPQEAAQIQQSVAQDTTGGAAAQQPGAPKTAPKEIINYKDMQPQGQVQMAAQAGIQLQQQPVVQAPQPVPNSGITTPGG